MPSKPESPAPQSQEEEEFEEEEEEEVEEEEQEEEEVEEEEQEEEEVEEEEENGEEEEEVEEEEEEEEEEVQEEDEEEPEEEEEEEEEENDDEKSADSASPDKKDDSEQEVESEDDGEESRLEKTKAASLTAEVHNTSGGHSDLVNSPNEFLNTQVRDDSHVDDGDTKPQILSKEVVASEDKGTQIVKKECLSDTKAFDSQPQKLVEVEGCVDVQKGNDETQCGDQNLNILTPTGTGKGRSSCINEKEVAVGTPVRDDSAKKVSNLLIKEETKRMDMQIEGDIKLKASSSLTPQIRPRSSSPGADFEDGNKRPAIICDFFARGWCIKGSSCKFLHQKDGVTGTSKSEMQDVPASSKDNLGPEHKFLSSGSITQSIGYGNVNPYDKYGSYTSTGFSSQNPNLNASVPSQGVPALNQTYTWAGSGLSQRSFDGDRGYYSSKSSLLGHSSSPFYSRHDPESFSLPIYNWEPSVPFRPSFNFSSFISSPRSQYDPLLDSIDRPSGEDRIFQEFSVSQGVITPNISRQKAKDDSISFHQKPQYGALRPSAEAARAFAPKEENSLKPGNIANTSNAMEVDHPNLSHQADGSKHNKESKALKHFRASLVEFVKELVRPHWRDGHLSKDAHNTVVKKAVEKVLSAFQPHQIPSTTESTTHYLSSCRPKLTRLVEGYVGKYANA